MMTARDWVIASRMPGMATQNSFGAHHTPFSQTMSDNGVLSIVGAGRVESALVAYQQTQGALINGDQFDSDLCQH